MKNILKFLDGKKTIISGVITLTSSYLVDMGQIDAKTGVYIASLCLIIFGSASIATKQMYQK